jgi:glycine cleavage system H protein
LSETNIPAELRYTAEHEWVQRTGPTTVRIGITDFAQSQLGDVVFVQLPAVDEAVVAGESLGEVESTKSVSDIYAPLNAKVIVANADLESSPELVNSEPYGNGWLVDLEVADEATLDAALGEMLDAPGYQAIAGG